MKSFQCFRVTQAKQGGEVQTLCVDQLTSGDTLIQTSFSSLNYKDALAVTGKGKILKKFPLNPGIDVAGTLLESSSPELTPGQEVVITGCQLGEIYDGGLSEVVRVPSSIVIPLPTGLTTEKAMIYGTAGFTAALARRRMEVNGLQAHHGPILVTGASGGVGSFAVNFFSQKGYEVHAVSGKPSQHDWLKQLGAHRVIHPDDLNLGHRPLEKGLWAGVVDNVGGELLSKLIPHVGLWGSVASIGLVGGVNWSGTVMPHILRGVSLLGISSNNCPWEMRLQIWKDLTLHTKTTDLEPFVSQRIPLNKALQSSQAMLKRQTFGRILVQF